MKVEVNMSEYPDSLIYYMWKWQVYFMISCKSAAESLFNKIDRQLQPTAFLIGFRADDIEQRPLICYEPEKMEFLHGDLQRIDSVAKRLDSSDPDRLMFYSGGMQDEMDMRRQNKNFRLALKKILDESDSFSDKIHFVAPAVLRDNYRVYIVLQLKKSIYEKYQHLQYRNPEEYLHKYLSFLEAVIDSYLEDYAMRLHLPNAGRDNGPTRDSTELLRTGAKSFMYTIALAGRGGNIHALYRACDELSLTRYEGRENFGHLIVCRADHPALELTLELSAPFSIEQYRKVRKMLELTNEETGVVTNGKLVLGLGKMLTSYNSHFEDFFKIIFSGLHCYDVMHVDHPLLLIRNGNPEPLGYLINYEKFVEDAKFIFTEITSTQVENMYDLSMAVAQRGRGSTLVFIQDAADESNRLANQCISIVPKKLDSDSVSTLASIDGAIVIDIDGFAHAKGVILDGIVGSEGDASRGSRYNSALTYCECRGWEKPSMVLVVSEDGMVDVIPKLMPRIRHSEIIQFIKTLESLDSPETFNDTTYYNMMNLVNARAFYLSAEECEQINSIHKSLEKLDRSSGKTVWRTFDSLYPNPKMNERYYIPE